MKPAHVFGVALLLGVSAILVALRRAAAAPASSPASSPAASPAAPPEASPSPAKQPRFMSPAEIEQRFGPLPWTPVPGNDSAIVIDPAWVAEHLITVEVPQLRDVPGADGGRVTFHKDAAPLLLSFFATVEKAGLLDRIKSFAGSYAPRRVRGRQGLSRHAYAVAFDINAPQNPLGTEPAPLGTPGSVVELVPLAEAAGFAWGGRFKGRKDGMHFEVAA